MVVFGGSGRVGGRLVAHLRHRGHTVTAASRATGVDVISGVGLEQALWGTEALIDATNPPEGADPLSFFERSAENLLKAEGPLPTRHHVVLSVVGCDRMSDSAYMRAKVMQETLVRQAGIPYTTVRATQFFEFLAAIGDAHVRDGVVQVPPVAMQPIALDDVAIALTEVAEGSAQNTTIDVAGPERLPMDEAVRRALRARGDRRPVAADTAARYFGAAIDGDTLTPRGAATIGTTALQDWIRSAPPFPSGT